MPRERGSPLPFDPLLVDAPRDRGTPLSIFRCIGARSPGARVAYFLAEIHSLSLTKKHNNTALVACVSLAATFAEWPSLNGNNWQSLKA